MTSVKGVPDPTINPWHNALSSWPYIMPIASGPLTSSRELDRLAGAEPRSSVVAPWYLGDTGPSPTTLGSIGHTVATRRYFTSTVSSRYADSPALTWRVLPAPAVQ